MESDGEVDVEGTDSEKEINGDSPEPNTRQHYCKQCNYGSDRKCNFTRHLEKMHTLLEKALICCGHAFTTKADHKAHVKKLHGGGYLCGHCNKVFPRKALLERHFSTHSGVKKFSCDTCQYRSSNKSNLHRHHTHCKGRERAPKKEKRQLPDSTSELQQISSPKVTQACKNHPPRSPQLSNQPDYLGAHITSPRRGSELVRMQLIKGSGTPRIDKCTRVSFDEFPLLNNTFRTHQMSVPLCPSHCEFLWNRVDNPESYQRFLDFDTRMAPSIVNRCNSSNFEPANMKTRQSFQSSTEVPIRHYYGNVSEPQRTFCVNSLLRQSPPQNAPIPCSRTYVGHQNRLGSFNERKKTCDFTSIANLLKK